MATYKDMLLDIIQPTTERQYGGGLDDAYMNRRSAFAAPDTNSAFASPMTQGGLPMIYREDGGTTIPKERMINDQPHQLSYINPEEAGLLQALGGSGRRVDGIPSYFFGDDGTGNDYGEGDAAAAEFTAEDQADADAGAAGSAEEGEEPDYTSYDSRGRSIQSGTPADTQLNAQNQAAAFRGGRQDYRDRFDQLDKIAPDSRFTNLELAQKGIDRGLYNKAGIPTANFLENRGLATFGKGMRGSLEAYTPGDALYRYEDEDSLEAGRGVYDPSTLTGSLGAAGGDATPAAREFDMRMRSAKEGETIADITIQMGKETDLSPEAISQAALDFGYSTNSTAQASQVYEALNDARGSGMLQGLGLIAGGALNPGGFFNSLMSSYDDKGENTTPVDTMTGQVLDATGVSSLADKFGIDKDNKVLSGINTAFNIAQRGPGVLVDILDPSRRSVLNKEDEVYKSTQDNIKAFNIAENLVNAQKDLNKNMAIELDKDQPNFAKMDELKEQAIASYKNIPDNEYERMLVANNMSMVNKGDSLYGMQLDTFQGINPDFSFKDELNRENVLGLIGESSIEEDLDNANDKGLPSIDTNKEVAEESNFIEDIVKGTGKLIGSFGDSVSKFLTGTFGSGDGMITQPVDSVNYGNESGLSKIRRGQQDQPKQVAAIVAEVAKTPVQVQRSIEERGLTPQYLALIKAGYTTEEAIKAIGAPAGTALT